MISSAVIHARDWQHVLPEAQFLHAHSVVDESHGASCSSGKMQRVTKVGPNNAAWCRNSVLHAGNVDSTSSRSRSRSCCRAPNSGGNWTACLLPSGRQAPLSDVHPHLSSLVVCLTGRQDTAPPPQQWRHTSHQASPLSRRPAQPRPPPASCCSSRPPRPSITAPGSQRRHLAAAGGSAGGWRQPAA
jgi:hypothetical protein